MPGPDVDRLGAIVVFSGQQNPFCRIGCVDELSTDLSRTPTLDLRSATVNRVLALLDQSRYHVAADRIEVVPRSVEIDR